MSEFAEGYAMGADRNNNCGFMPCGMGGFGGGWGGDWLAIIVLAALFGNGGWGFGGFGGGGGYGGGIYGDVQRGFDTAGINNKLNGIENGLCDGFYAVNTGMLNGFAGAERSIMQSGYETRSAITDVGYALKDCCCQTPRHRRRKLQPRYPVLRDPSGNRGQHQPRDRFPYQREDRQPAYRECRAHRTALPERTD